MAVSATKWKTGIQMQPKHLYETGKSGQISMEEAQKDGTRDRVVLDFQLKTGQKGYFASEYLPAGVSQNGKNVIDITAVMRDDLNKQVRWHLYDIKDTLAGEHTAAKLCDQWNAGLTYLQQGILCELEGYKVDSDIGVFTRSYNEYGMQNTRRLLEDKLEGLNPDEKVPLAKKKSYANIPKYKAQLLAVQMILDREFCPEAGKQTYPINIGMLAASEGRVYQIDFVV